MFIRLLLAFTLIPIIELALLIELGTRIGSLPTIGLVILTGLTGAWLAKQQGWAAVDRIRQEANAGRVPADPLLDGLFVLVGAVTLLTPGLLTDILGLSLLLPLTRRYWRRWIKTRFDRWIRTGTLRIW